MRFEGVLVFGFGNDGFESAFWTGTPFTSSSITPIANFLYTNLQSWHNAHMHLWSTFWLLGHTTPHLLLDTFLHRSGFASNVSGSEVISLATTVPSSSLSQKPVQCVGAPSWASWDTGKESWCERRMCGAASDGAICYSPDKMGSNMWHATQPTYPHHDGPPHKSCLFLASVD